MNKQLETSVKTDSLKTGQEIFGTDHKPGLRSRRLLWFLAIAAKRKFRVDRYRDQAGGILAKNADGKWCISVVTLQPEVQFSGEPLPTREQIEAMHHTAHTECYIANSVTAQVRVEPVWPSPASA